MRIAASGQHYRFSEIAIAADGIVGGSNCAHARIISNFCLVYGFNGRLLGYGIQNCRVR